MAVLLSATSACGDGGAPAFAPGDEEHRPAARGQKDGSEGEPDEQPGPAMPEQGGPETRDAALSPAADAGVDEVAPDAGDGEPTDATSDHHAGVRELSLAGAPAARRSPQAVWTGSEMIVFGGSVYPGQGAALGGRYDPERDAWSPLPTQGAPCFRKRDGYVYAAFGAWTGTRLLVFCGAGDDHAAFGSYDPKTDAWSLLASDGAPALAPAVWTGKRLLVIGDYLGAAASYDPMTDAWTPIAGPDPTLVGGGATLVWTGELVLFWGGEGGSGYLDTGAAYDPATDAWRPLSNKRAPSGRSLHTAVWTGSAMLVWGGYDGHDERLADGGSYDPATDSWTPIAAGALSGRERHSAVWTGSEMLLWGGAHGPPYPIDKGAYDPVTRRYRRFDDPDYRYEAGAVWTGSELLIWGGVAIAESDVFRTGIAYRP